MICVPCREKYYSDNKISADKYIPTKSDFNKSPCVFGVLVFMRPQLRNIQHNLTNSTV